MSNNEQNNLRISIPPHLDRTFWLDFEFDSAIGLWQSLEKELTKLAKHVSVRRVHDTRVTLRRWNALWKILRRDGWESTKYKTTINKKLRSLRRLLGELRDWDVNLQIGQTFTLPAEITKEWTKKRSQAIRAVSSQLKQLDVEKLLKQLHRYLEKRRNKLRSRLKSETQPKISAYRHLERYLVELERASYTLERHAQSMEELHKLRLSIKDWRYFLTEFFGLTNLQLVKAQQMLGKSHDLQQVLYLLQAEKNKLLKAKIARIKKQQATYLQEFEIFRKSLPYGLRPAVISLVRN